MDPIHLETEELEYELNLRGVNNVGTARQKTQCLKDFMNREENGEQVIVPERVELLGTHIELLRCVESFSRVSAHLEEPMLGDAHIPICRSRLLHIIARVKRTRPVTPEEQTAAADVLRSAERVLADIAPQRSLNVAALGGG